MDDRTVYASPAGNYLLVVRGPGQGRMFLLMEGVNTIGRAEGNDFVLEPADMKASRRHVAVRLESGQVYVKDLESKNGTYLDGALIESALLPPGAELCVGETVFVLTTPTQAVKAVSQAQEKPRSRVIRSRALWIIAALVILAGLSGFFLPYSDRTPKSLPDAATNPGPGGASAPPGQPEPLPQTGDQSGKPSGGSTEAGKEGGRSQPAPEAGDASPQSAQAAESLRMGQFFYNSGNLRKAVEHWREAVASDPANPQASRQLARAETELNQLVDRHYRQGLTALRYQRTEEARAEFRQVVENSLNPDDERTRDSLKKLEETGGR